MLKTILMDMGGAKYLALLLLPLLATPLVGIEFLLPALADLFANLLSANPMPRGVIAYHSVSIVPLLFAAGIYGSARIARRGWFSTTSIGSRVFWASLVFGYLVAPLPLPYAFNYWRPSDWPVAPEKAVSEIRALLPPDVSISAQGNVAAHFSQRYRIYAFPTKANEVDAVVLRLASPTTRTADKNPHVIGSLGHHLLMPPAEYLAAVENILDGDVYSVVYWKQPWLVLSKTTGIVSRDKQSAKLYLVRLKEEWRVGNPTAGGNPI